MKRIAIAELSGAALNCAVLIAISGEVDEELSHSGVVFGTWGDLANSERFDPGANWSQCGPLIERYKIELCFLDGFGWTANAQYGPEFSFYASPLVAACRAIVARHNPDGYVEVPVELLEAA